MAQEFALHIFGQLGKFWLGCCFQQSASGKHIYLTVDRLGWSSWKGKKQMDETKTTTCDQRALRFFVEARARYVTK